MTGRNVLDDDPIVQALLHDDHVLRSMWRVVDFSHVPDWVAEHCTGPRDLLNDQWELLARLAFLQHYSKRTDEEVLDSAQVDCSYRYFINLPWGEALPEACAITRFRHLVGVDGYRELMGGLIEQAFENGLVGKRRLNIDVYPVKLDARTQKLVAELDQKVEVALSTLTGPAGPGPEAVDLRRRLDAIRQDASYELGAAWRERWFRTWLDLGARAEYMVEHRDDPDTSADKEIMFRLQRVRDNLSGGNTPFSWG